MKKTKLAILVAAALSLTALATVALRVPIYSDEITYHLILGSDVTNGGVTATLYPHCRPPEDEIPGPALFVPFRAAGGLLYDLLPRPPSLRVLSLFLLLANMFLLFRIAVRTLGSPILAASFTIGTCTLGVTALNWSIHRPESWLVLAIQSTILLVLGRARSESKGTAAISIAITTAVSMAALSIHPNALYMIPFFLLSIWLHELSTVTKFAAGALVLFAAASTYLVTGAVTACPQDPFLRMVFQSYALHPGLFFEDPGQFIVGALQNAARIPAYFEALLHRASYPHGWMPSSGTGATPVLLNLLAVFGWVLITLQAILARSPKEDLRQTPTTRLMLSATLAIALGAVTILQSLKNFYSSQLFILLLANLMLIFPWRPILRSFQMTERTAHWITATIFGIAAINSAYLLIHSALSESWSPEELHRASIGTLSVPMTEFDAVDEKIDALAKRCELPSIEDNHRLVVDDLTYWHFRKSRKPIHAFYIGRSIYGNSIANAGLFLNFYKSTGILTRCWELERFPELLGRALRLDGLCCIPPKDFLDPQAIGK